jgi:hypothetical protein
MPALAGGAVGNECNLIVLDARDVFHDAFAVRCPSIDAEGEVSFRRGHLRPLLVHSSWAAGAWVKHSPPKRLRNASAVAASGKQNRIELVDLVSTPAAADWDASFTVERINF